MTLFSSKFDIPSGKTEWVVMDDDAFDFSQQIARSAYADMLHDNDRNEKYFQALKKAISKTHASGREAIVLDIGTGTGLLSMMAADCGAKSVFACELFKPMSNCAEKIIKLNGFENKIKVINKNSRHLTVGENGDIPCKANILVTEVFDTELIGEGAIKTFMHAQQELLEKDAIFIPSLGRIYACVFESNLVNSFNKVDNLYYCNENMKNVKIPDIIKNCSGSPSVHDIQISQLPNSCFKLISNPEMIFEFDWSGKQPIQQNEIKFVNMKSKYASTAHGVFMWWDLLMDSEGEIVISCSPEWPQIKDKNSSWRDHWMQAVYYFSENVKLETNQEFILLACHDEFSLWFDIKTNINYSDTLKYLPPVCTCGLHLTSRLRIGMINDKSRQEKFSKVLSQYIKEDTICVNLSECSLLSHYAALLGAEKVYCYETNRIFQNVLKNIALYNNIQNKLYWESTAEKICESLKQKNEKISLVLAEPYFSSSILPWHNLQFWFLKRKLSSVFSENVHIIPSSVEFYLMPVQFENLWKIRAPVKKFKEFDLKSFDDIIQRARNFSDEIIDAQPLWEYPCVALHEPKKFLHFNFNQNSFNDILSEDKFQFQIDGKCDGVVLWVNWILNKDENIEISTGPTKSVVIGSTVHWDMYSKQGVYFFLPRKRVSTFNYLYYSIKYYSETADFNYKFQIL